MMNTGIKKLSSLPDGSVAESPNTEPDQPNQGNANIALISRKNGNNRRTFLQSKPYVGILYMDEQVLQTRVNFLELEQVITFALSL